MRRMQRKKIKRALKIGVAANAERTIKKSATPTSANQQNFNFGDAGLKAIEDLKLELQSSFKGLSDEILQLKTEFSSEFRDLKNEVKQLKKQLVEKDTIIENLTNQVNVLNQYGRNKTFEIDNIEEATGEDVELLVLNVAKILNIGVKEEDIDVAHRIPSRKAGPHK